MKNKSFLKPLFTIAFPIILQDFLSSFVNMLDTIMVGQLGAVDIAAVGLGNQIFFVMSLGVFGIASGGQIFIAQYWGKKDLDRIHRTTGMMLQLSLAFTALFAAVSIIFPEFCLSIYSNDVGVFRSGGDTLFALFMDVGFLWLLALPLGWLAVLVWHLPFWAVYLCILSEPVCKSIVGINRLLSNKWLRRL